MKKSVHQRHVHARFTQHMVIALERRDYIVARVERLFLRWWDDFASLFSSREHPYPWFQLAVEKRYQKLWREVDRLLDKEFRRNAEWAYDDTFQAMVDTLPWEYWTYLEFKSDIQEAVDVSLATDPKGAKALYTPMSSAQTKRIIYSPPPGAKDGLSWDKRIDRLSGQVSNHKQVADRIASGIANGQNPRVIAKDIAPFVNRDKAAAERIARTEALRVSHMAKREQMEQFRDVMSGWKIVATLDDRTRPHHAERHGDYYAYPQPNGDLPDGAKGHAEERPMVPDEPNCRCDDQPVIMDLEGVFDPEETPAVVASVDGPIEDPLVFGNWFDNQPLERRMKIVGRRRWQLMAKKLDEIGAGESPSWTDFIMPDDGTLVPVKRLKAETAVASKARSNLNVKANARRLVALKQETHLPQLAADTLELEKLSPFEKALAEARQMEYRRLYGLRKKYGEAEGKSRYVTNRMRDLEKRMRNDALTNIEATLLDELGETDFLRRMRSDFQKFADSGGKAVGAPKTIGAVKGVAPTPAPPAPKPVKAKGITTHPTKPTKAPTAPGTPAEPKWVNPEVKVATDFSSSVNVPDEPITERFVYHVTTRKNAAKILAEGFDIDKVKPRWLNDKAISFTTSKKAAMDWFTPSGGTFDESKYVVLKTKIKGRFTGKSGIVPRGSVKDADAYRWAFIREGYDGTTGKTVYVYNRRSIVSIEPETKFAQTTAPVRPAKSLPKKPEQPTPPPVQGGPSTTPEFTDSSARAIQLAREEMDRLGVSDLAAELGQTTYPMYGQARPTEIMTEIMAKLRQANNGGIPISVDEAIAASPYKRDIVQRFIDQMEKFAEDGRGRAAAEAALHKTKAIPGRYRSSAIREFKEFVSCCDDDLLTGKLQGFAQDDRNKLRSITLARCPGRYGAANHADNVIRLGDDWGEATGSTLCHEFGHHLMYRNGRVAERWSEWWHERVRGLPEKSSKSYGYTIPFPIIEDKFSNPYLGRVYHGFDVCRNGGGMFTVDKSEAMSTAAELFHNIEHAGRTFKRDPDHFRLMWATMRGY